MRITKSFLFCKDFFFHYQFACVGVCVGVTKREERKSDSVLVVLVLTVFSSKSYGHIQVFNRLPGTDRCLCFV